MDIPVDDKAVVGFTAVLVYFFKDIVRIVGAWSWTAAPWHRAERDNHDYRFA